MKISELETLSGLTRDTIRYYERIGLLSPPVRKSNSYRVYTQKHLRELAFIKKGREIGFSLEEIKHGAKSFAVNGKLCRESVSQLKEKKLEILQRMENDKNALRKIERLLSGSVE